MSCVLTKGRNNPCLDNIGGVKYIYFLPYVYYSDEEIESIKGVEITEFPETEIFRYEPNTSNFSETIENDENGVKVIQNLSLSLAKQDLITSLELERMKSIDLRYIVQYNNGKLRMGGVYNGARLDSYTIKSGGIKSDFNGYELSISSVEEYAAPFLSDLNILGDNFLLLENSFNILLENNFKVILD